MNNLAKLLYFSSSSGGGEEPEPFDPATIQSKFAGWWKDEKDDYIVDQLGVQERETLTQNGQAGQLFPGRALQFSGSTDRAIVADNGALDIGSNSAFSIAVWVKFTSFTGFSRFLGKIVNASTAGEYYFSTTSNGVQFNCRGTGGLSTVTLISPQSTDTWYHFIITIDSGQVMRGYVNKVAAGTTPTISGSISSIASTTGFGVNCSASLVSGATGYGGTVQYRDLRIFKGKVLSAQERTDVYDGRWVEGFTEWWPMSDNDTLRVHSAKNGGLHMTASGLDGTSLITGYWRQVYNRYGYAEDATYGQIPADLSTLEDGDDAPTVDCYGNALVFAGTAKQHLAKSGGNLVMYDEAASNQLDDLILSSRVISLNTWFSGNTAQAVATGDIATYCGSRQFYNSSTKELIIIKKDQHLTTDEETNLMSYLGNPSISTTYHVNTTALIARFTNTYTDAEKSRIDNMMRLLVARGVYTKLEGFVMAAMRGTEEQILDWINEDYNIEPAGNGSVDYTPYRGLVPAAGAFKNNFVTNTGTKFTQNDAFYSFKLAQNFSVPYTGTIFGSQNTGVSHVGVNFLNAAPSGVSAKRIRFFINDSFGASNIITGIDTNRTFVLNRTSSSSVNAVADDTALGASSSTSAARNSLGWFIGDRNADGLGYINCMNWIQHIAWGSALSEQESKDLTLIVDNFCNGQLALAPEELDHEEFTYKYSDHVILSRIGENILYSDWYNLYYSTDGGATVAASMAFDCNTLGWFHMAHIFDDGKIIFATNKNKFYKTTTALSSYTELTPTKNGAPYTIHTPANSSLPGEYYKQLGIMEKQYLGDGTEIYVWNAYQISVLGTAPTCVWYSFGEEVKVAYEFGQNPYLRDDGTNGGGTTGNFVGDASVLNWCRHGHGVLQRPDDKTKFIGIYGDNDRLALAPADSDFFESQWMEYTYDQVNDTWSSSIIKKGTHSGRWKSTFGALLDGYAYWGVDAAIEVGMEGERGIWKAPIDEIDNAAAHTHLYNNLDTDRIIGFFHYDGEIFLCGGYSYIATDPNTGISPRANIVWSKDMVNFHEVNLNVPGNVFCQRMFKISEGKYQLDMIPDLEYFKGAQSLILTFK